VTTAEELEKQMADMKVEDDNSEPNKKDPKIEIENKLEEKEELKIEFETWRTKTEKILSVNRKTDIVQELEIRMIQFDEEIAKLANRMQSKQLHHRNQAENSEKLSALLTGIMGDSLADSISELTNLLKIATDDLVLCLKFHLHTIESFYASLDRKINYFLTHVVTAIEASRDRSLAKDAAASLKTYNKRFQELRESWEISKVETKRMQVIILDEDVWWDEDGLRVKSNVDQSRLKIKEGFHKYKELAQKHNQTFSKNPQ